jgi:hypothetical protein
MVNGGGWTWEYKRGLDMYVPCILACGWATANPHVSVLIQ